MKKKTAITVEIIFVLIMVISAIIFIAESIGYKKADDTYTQMNEDYIEITEETTNKTHKKNNNKNNKKNDNINNKTDYKLMFDYNKLLKENSEVEGYIYLHNSNISYPIVRHNDNAYYLTHDALKNYSINGSIFIDCTNEDGLDGRHCIIYGHHMDNGSMLADICKFSDESFAKKHTEFTVFNKNVQETYTVISSFVTLPDNKKLYTTNFGSLEEYQAWIDYCLSNSTIDYKQTATAADKTILLSTCTNRGNTRSVVVIKKNIK